MDPLLRLLKTAGSAVDADLRSLGLSRDDFRPPSMTLRECIAEVNGRIGNGGTGMISEEKLLAIRHYLTEFALIFHTT